MQFISQHVAISSSEFRWNEKLSDDIFISDILLNPFLEMTQDESKNGILIFSDHLLKTC